MIVSASRRTDIPAVYPEWFLNCVRAGSVDVPNPLNRHQVRTVALTPDAVDCFVFWSKNPQPMLPFLGELSAYPYYFQFTLNAYGSDVEPQIPDKQGVIQTFRSLAERIGPDRVVWRYDPIFMSPRFDISWHIENFAGLAASLSGCTDSCIISFGDVYRKNARRLQPLNLYSPEVGQIRDLAEGLAGICRDCGLSLQTCAEKADLSAFGITHANCIDVARIERLTGRSFKKTKDKNQRPACGCAASVDIGCYNTCPLGCLYCYAN